MGSGASQTLQTPGMKPRVGAFPKRYLSSSKMTTMKERCFASLTLNTNFIQSMMLEAGTYLKVLPTLTYKEGPFRLDALFCCCCLPSFVYFFQENTHMRLFKLFYALYSY